MKTKICFKCKEEKLLSEFYKHSQMSDGHLNKCRECCKNYTKEHRIENIEYYKKYEKERNKKPHRVQARKEYQKNNTDKFSKYSSEWSKKNKHKRNAQLKVKRAIEKGILTRPETCSKCGSDSKIEAHHTDYSKPLDIMWLCVKCHNAEHWGE